MTSLHRGKRERLVSLYCSDFRIHLASHLPLILRVVVLVVRAAGSRNHRGLLGLQLPSNIACFPFFLKEINGTVSLPLSASQQGCLALKARGIKDPGICILKLSVLAQHFRSQAQSSQQLQIPPCSIEPTQERLIPG